MKKIVSVIKPFVIQQNIFVYSDGEKEDIISVPLDEIQNKLVEISYQYNINEIELIGSKKYLKEIGNKIKEAEMNKYSNNNIIINIVTN